MTTLKTNMVTTQDYYSLALIVWSTKLKLKMFIKILVRIKKCLILVILQLIHDETIVVAIKDFVGLKPKMYSFLVDDNSEHDNEKGVNKNVVERLIHSEYKNVLLNRKCLRHLINRFHSKNHRIGTYEINKIYTLNNGYDGLAFGY